MTTHLAPPRPAPEGLSGPPPRPGGPVPVTVTRAPLGRHEPLDLYAALAERLGDDEVFLLESFDGPDGGRGPATVGHGRLAEIRVHAAHLEIEAATGPLRDMLVAAALDAGAAGPRPAQDSPRHTLDGTTRLDFTGSGPVWRLLDLTRGLFAVDTEIPEDGYAFGFLAAVGYEASWHMEELPDRSGSRGGPDLTLTLFRDTVRYDPESGGAEHLAARSAAFPGRPPVDTAALVAALPAPRTDGGDVPVAPPPLEVSDSVSRDTFLAWADRCLRHIGVGDAYQIQIGHRVDVRTELTPLDVYRRLRHRNPSPHMYLCPWNGGRLIGASPELLFRTVGGEIEMRPIAGTTRRGPDGAENRRRVEEMLASTKEQAEHIMLVDLCRNDIGRVARPGSLDVPALMTVEAFSHVFHLVSTVTGRLDGDVSPWDALRATFPAGTMTGAPKLRAMEIIDGLEREPRGIYAGAVGLVDARGWSELALCIRTIVHDGDTYSTQSSAGMVAESDPAAEWNETLAKTAAARWALTGEELS